MKPASGPRRQSPADSHNSGIGYSSMLAVRWNTHTCIAGLRHGRIASTGVMNRAMYRGIFKLYVESIMAPKLCIGSVVIFVKLPARKSVLAQSTYDDVGLWFLFPRK